MVHNHDRNQAAAIVPCDPTIRYLGNGANAGSGSVCGGAWAVRERRFGACLALGVCCALDMGEGPIAMWFGDFFGGRGE